MDAHERAQLTEEDFRGEKARMILENPVYDESWTKVREAIIKAWENAPIRDKEGQNELKLMLKLLVDARKNLETVMQTGKLARLQIEREESRLNSAIRMFRK